MTKKDASLTGTGTGTGTGNGIAVISQLVTGASDAAFAIDDFHRVVAWNGRAQDLLGYTAEEVIGLRCEEALQAMLPGGEPLCRPNCDVFNCFRNCQPSAVPSCRVRTKDGDWKSVGYSSLVMPDQGEGEPDGSVVAVIFLHERDALPASASRLSTPPRYPAPARQTQPDAPAGSKAPPPDRPE